MYYEIYLILITMHRYKELEVWKLSMIMVEDIYMMTDKFPFNEQFVMISQIRRAAVSVPSNIAEGAGRRTNTDFRRYASMASGSCNELETQLIISRRLNYLSATDFDKIIIKLSSIQNMLFRLQQALRST